MVKRICSTCNTPWYSADSSNDWTCNTCGTTLGPELNESAENHASKPINVRNSGNLDIPIGNDHAS